MQRILVSGSLAYDHLYTFKGVFQDTLKINAELLSVAFNVSDKAVHFGGCAGNIVYNGSLLGEDFVLLGIAGKDFGDYEMWLRKNSIDTSRVILDPDEYTSQATVVTDKAGQQITFFHTGAAEKALLYKERIKKNILELAGSLAFAIVSPNSRDFMLASLEACSGIKVPYFFDPGQAMALFSSDELAVIARGACGMIFNEYEFNLLQSKLGLSVSTIRKLCPLIIVTHGESGSVIYFQQEEIRIPAIPSKHPKDPTGCGDAYRAGFLAGIKKTFPKLVRQDLENAAKLGTRLAAACLTAVGTQNHTFP